jgi:hypothetical protein
MKGASVVFDGGNIMTLSRHGDFWIVAYSKPLSNDVVARTADKIEGPWSDEVKLFVADHGDDSTVYDAYLHPELGDERTLILSYTRNTPEPFSSVTVLHRVDVAP